MEWSGVEWSGVEWSGVEWSGVEWSGVEWSGVTDRSVTGPVTAGSPEEDRTEEVVKARGFGWTGWAGRFEKARRGAGPNRAGQEDGGGVGRSRRRAAERSAEEFATERVCVVQGSVHSGQRAQGSSQSDRR